MAQFANKYYLDKNGNEVFVGMVEANKSFERDSNIVYRCCGQNNEGKTCGIPVILCTRQITNQKGEIIKTKYFKEASIKEPHIEDCDQYEKGRDLQVIKMLIKEGGPQFDFNLFSARMSKNEKVRGGGPGPGRGPWKPGGDPEPGDNGNRYKSIDFRDVLPQNINELSEVFDELGAKGEYGKKKVYEMYLSPETIKYYNKGVWNTTLVKANKSLSLHNAPEEKENIRKNGYYHLVLRGETNTFDFVLIPRNEIIGKKIMTLILKYRANPEKQFLVLGNWKRYKDCYNVFCCEINNMKQIKAVRN